MISTSPLRGAFIGGLPLWMGAALAIGPWNLGASVDESNSEPKMETHNVVLMFDQGPIHARFHISLRGQSIDRQRETLVAELMQRFDDNRDGKLTRLEANHSNVLRRRRQPGTDRFLQKLGLQDKQQMTPDEVHRLVEQFAGQTVVFRQNDVAAESDFYFFSLLDEDQSGIVDASEMVSAARRLAVRDTDRDQCVGFDEVQPPLPQTGETDIAAPSDLSQQDSEDPSHPLFSDLIQPTGSPHLSSRMMQKYDRNGNGRLSPQELHWQADRLATIDADHDGELSRAEILRIQDTPADIEVSTDVSPAHSSRPDFHVESRSGRRLDANARPGLATFMLSNATLSISYRHVDPIDEALQNAQQKFNLLDADRNGYLDSTEVEKELLLQRGLFAEIDADGDGKMFGTELESYVRDRSEVKSMSCRVTIFDTGRGYFHTLDRNNDGRISVREGRSAAESLQSLAVDSDAGVSSNEPPRRFHLEFSRGSYLLFGPSERSARQAISFNTQVPVGPPWFVGSDRNNDGDLTWQEFLGERNDFRFLDVDCDQLVDPVEAERANLLR